VRWVQSSTPRTAWTMTHARYAIRQLLRRPALSLTVIVMLALGIGAATAIFSLFHQVLIQPLPVPEPERLVNLVYADAGDSSPSDATSYPMFRDLEAQQTVFTGIAARVPLDANVTFGDTAVRISGELVSGSYFQVLGLVPALGRLIAPSDEPAIGESSVVVLSHDLWRNRFGADPDVVGRELTVNGRLLTVVGVAPARFSGLQRGVRARFFLPLTMRAQIDPNYPPDVVFESRGFSTLTLTARLRAGIDVKEASTPLNAVYRRIRRELDAPARDLTEEELQRFLRGRVDLQPGARGWGSLEAAERSLTLLLGVTLVVLAIVCVNVANLWFVRNGARAGEMAVRESLGAGRGRLIADLLMEAAVPAVIGGVLSFPAAAGMLRAIVPLLPPRLADGLIVRISPAAAVFAAVATVSAALLSSLLPALRASRTSPPLMMKGTASQTLGRRGAPHLRGGLATVQIAFSMALLVLAALFAQSLANVARIDLGFDVDSLVSFSVAPRLNGYGPEQVASLYERIAEELSAQPGVVNVTPASVPLIAGSNFGLDGLRIEGVEDAAEPIHASFNLVGVSFFETLSIGIRAGRGFTNADVSSAATVAIVNERFVSEYGLQDNAIGRRLLFGPDDSLEIVGVVADAAYSGVKADVPPQLFVPRTPSVTASLFGFMAAAPLTFYVRTAIDPDALLRVIPRVVASVDPALPVTDLVTTRRQAQENVFVDRLVAILSASFAALATLLAAIGLYGVLASGIAQRTRELGLRLALGAEPSDLRAMVLRQVVSLAAIGIVIGCLAAIGFGRLAESLLYDLDASDPGALIGAAAVLTAVVSLAAYVPARRASKIAPMEALRYD
jgi:putative ABC transport system permease protein